MASGYIKNRKLSKFKSSRHSGRTLGGDEREKVAAKTMKDTNKKEAKRESIYDKSE